MLLNLFVYKFKFLFRFYSKNKIINNYYNRQTHTVYLQVIHIISNIQRKNLISNERPANRYKERNPFTEFTMPGIELEFQRSVTSRSRRLHHRGSRSYHLTIDKF